MALIFFSVTQNSKYLWKIKLNKNIPSYFISIAKFLSSFDYHCEHNKKERNTEKKTKERFIKRVHIRHKEKLSDMATQLAVQRNFVTISPSDQISSSTPQSNHSTTTITTPATNGEVVTIADGNQVSPSETNNGPIHIMQTHTQVI